jgi:hypothetical protein
VGQTANSGNQLLHICAFGKGTLADLVVLADDLPTMSKNKIKDIEIVRTVTAGRRSTRSNSLLLPYLDWVSEVFGDRDKAKRKQKPELWALASD